MGRLHICGGTVNVAICTHSTVGATVAGCCFNAKYCKIMPNYKYNALE